MYHASSEARKVTILDMASGVPKVFKGTRCWMAAAKPSIWSELIPVLPKMGVLTGPGFTEFILIFLGANSVDAVRV